MKQHSKYESNWLVIFLTMLVGIWVVPPVLGTLNRLLWSAVCADAPLLSEPLPVQLFGGMITLGTIVVFILVITKLGKWNVLWPVFAGFLLVRLWGMIWPHLISLVHLIYTLNGLWHRDSRWVWGVFPAITVLIYLAAATLTFVLVRRHGRVVHSWLTTFLTVLVGVWLFELVSSALLNTLQWLVFVNNPWQWHRIADSINVIVALVSLAALVVVVHKPRKWPVLWPAPVFFVIVHVWRSHIMPYLHSWFFERAFASDPSFRGDALPPALRVVTPLLYLTAALLIVLLVRRHNKKSLPQPAPSAASSLTSERAED
ncbi:MAG: hypothetical protein FWD06_00595 [Oscillospiraceae bacterium]|nr:hypothetical protein [Oscillospiraceae bacterium]